MASKHTSITRARHAFSLIEMMAVLVILAILLAIGKSVVKRQADCLIVIEFRFGKLSAVESERLVVGLCMHRNVVNVDPDSGVAHSVEDRRAVYASSGLVDANREKVEGRLRSIRITLNADR